MIFKRLDYKWHIEEMININIQPLLYTDKIRLVNQLILGANKSVTALHC